MKFPSSKLKHFQASQQVVVVVGCRKLPSITTEEDCKEMKKVAVSLATEDAGVAKVFNHNWMAFRQTNQQTKALQYFCKQVALA